MTGKAPEAVVVGGGLAGLAAAGAGARAVAPGEDAELARYNDFLRRAAADRR